jgi:hypothetical protein
MCTGHSAAILSAVPFDKMALAFMWLATSYRKYYFTHRRLYFRSILWLTLMNKLCAKNLGSALLQINLVADNHEQACAKNLVSALLQINFVADTHKPGVCSTSDQLCG